MLSTSAICEQPWVRLSGRLFALRTESGVRRHPCRLTRRPQGLRSPFCSTCNRRLGRIGRRVACYPAVAEHPWLAARPEPSSTGSDRVVTDPPARHPQSVGVLRLDQGAEPRLRIPNIPAGDVRARALSVRGHAVLEPCSQDGICRDAREVAKAPGGDGPDVAASQQDRRRIRLAPGGGNRCRRRHQGFTNRVLDAHEGLGSAGATVAARAAVGPFSGCTTRASSSSACAEPPRAANHRPSCTINVSKPAIARPNAKASPNTGLRTHPLQCMSSLDNV